MRLFIAIELPADLRLLLYRTGAYIKSASASTVLPENIHLTIKFLGDLSKQESETVVARLKSVSFRKFPLCVRGTGVFPNEQFVRIIWVGIDPSQELDSLVSQICSLVQDFGKTEPFAAHITISRIKGKFDAKEFLTKNKSTRFGEFEVASFELVESVLTSSGPKYTILARFGSST